MITGTLAAVRAVATILDNESKLPYTSIPCICGSIKISVEDYDAEIVKCASCGITNYAGDRSATIQINKVYVLENGTAQYHIDDFVSARITEAKTRPPVKTPEEETLSDVEIT